MIIIVIIVTSRWVKHDSILKKVRISVAFPVVMYYLTGEHFLLIIVIVLIIEDRLLETSRIELYLIEEI